MKIFLSAVSSQFKDCRDALRSDLSAVGAEVIVQEDFQQHGASLLEKLERYISSCDRIIALVGDAYGFESEQEARPADARGVPIRSGSITLPKANGWMVRTRRAKTSSFTLHHRTTSRCALPHSPRLQQEFNKELKRSGKDRNEFGGLHELRALVLRDGFRLKAPLARRTIHNLPFAPNPLFIGRKAEFEALSRGLEQGDATAAMQMVAVHGLGRVGKTQLAVEYAWKHLDEYDAAFWVKADSALALDVGLAALASRLGLADTLEREETVQRQGVLDWLSNNQRWLLIVDNADNTAATSAVLERLSPSLTGHVIITSKISGWPSNVREVRLDPLQPDEATRYLLDRVAKSGHNAGAQAAAGLLAHELGNLPIALEQAASFIVEVCWSFDKSGQQLRESGPELLSVAKTWSIALNQLTPLARALLRIAAWWFSIDAIPRSVFTVDREVLSEALNARASGPDLAIDKALGELNRFSLIRLGNETFSVRRLLQAAEQDSLTSDEKQRWCEWAIRLYIKFYTSEAERKHLLNLGRGRTSNYQGRHSLRSELRHLRWMGSWR
jgi:hypothetical protein